MRGDIVKTLFKKLGFHKMDEMQRYITFKAQRNAYIFLTIALLVWSLYESIKVYIYHTKLNPLPCLLLVTASLIQIFSQLMMERSAVKDDEDSYETEPLFKIIILICVVTGIIATVGASFILMGVTI